MKKQTVVFKKPHEEACVIETDFGFKSLQELLGGNVKSIPLESRLDLLFVEDGIDKKYDLNVALNGNIIVGNLIVVGTDGFVWQGLSNKESKKIIKYLNKQTI